MGKYISIDYKNLKIEPREVTEGSLIDTTIAGHTAKRWEGLGYFDIIMNAFDKNIQGQAESGRITGPDYAKVYVQLIQIAIDKAIDIAKSNEDLVLKAAELELKEGIADLDTDLKKQELELRKKLAESDLKLKILEEEVKRAQIHVLDRQTEGFATNLILKLLESQQNNFAMMVSSGMLDVDKNPNAYPACLTAEELTKVYDKLFKEATKPWEKENDALYLVEERIKRAAPTSGIKL